ncbi:MAG TPA: hypothetical protein VGO14_00310 [Solirubrobacteraceae bacterium]|jgi:hypothetical protein|nr:hypothetical protein [Solirubrobacteraceae bacterium]
MVRTRCIVAGAAVLCAALLWAAAAGAQELVTITEAGFSPSTPGMPTNAFGSATISSTTGPVPSPIRHVNVYGPAGVTLDLQGTGVCSEAVLLQSGPQACPANSRAGFGGGEGIYQLGKELVEEKYTLDFFLSDNRPGHTKLVIFLSGSTPVIVEVVLTGTVIQGPPPYGLGFSVDVPLIKVLPEASNASAKSAFLTLGAHNVAYYRKVHGKRKLFHVKGIVLPKSCPRAGWPVASQFTFEDGSTVMAKRTVHCHRK